ncbi:hypothetical protein ACVRXQ_06645 [Streptococcus panodentis]|uniref:Thioredoxin domain-containing protein n=1 Tax=Streptococcus panodentis TaxID=1581472 RepID=A0ABS5AV87_9STRE|nr:hypothetical protein [Streptococcus panodentis]MBP2620465.1 hypothetical protein [Streptococcus panodentis]
MSAESHSVFSRKHDSYVLLGFICLCLLSWFLWHYQINIGHRLIWSSSLSLSFPVLYLIFVCYYLRVRLLLRDAPSEEQQERALGPVADALILLSFSLLLLTLIGVAMSFFSNQVTYDKMMFIEKDSRRAQQVFQPASGSYEELLERIEGQDRQVVFFYKLSCRKCQRSVPALLSRVRDKRKILFVDGASEAGQKLTQHYGIDQVSTALVWEKGGYQVYSLATKEDDGLVTIQEAEMKRIVDTVNESGTTN